MSHDRPRYRLRRGRRDRGVLLAIVLLLLGVVIATAAVAIWGLRGDTGAAGRDRVARQLLDCAEQGLAFGKQYFSTVGRPNWTTYYSTNVYGIMGAPFPANAPNAPVAGGYPTGAPFVQQVTQGTTSMSFQVAIYNNPDDASGPLAEGSDNRAIVVSRCTDAATGQTRTLQSMITSAVIISDDYLGQAGRGMRNQGNANNQ
jgi:hypothetical protein